jgi:hypothetical protein
MDQSADRLVSLVHVLKYYPILNYSYPRYVIFPHSGMRSSINESFYRPERLTTALMEENRSELELWDTYWKPEVGARIRKGNPALVATQGRMGRSSHRDYDKLNAGWPLPEALKSKPRRLRAVNLPFTQALDTIHE